MLLLALATGCVFIGDGDLQVRMDLDGDGFSRGIGPAKDCDDLNKDIHPEAEETWYDGVDQNCDGNDTDADGDGHAWEGGESGDCDDTDPESYPGAVEQLHDDVDQDCDGLVQQDLDEDGYLSNYTDADDCDDLDADVHPGAEEICMDGLDNDCDGLAGDCMIEGDLDFAYGADVVIFNNIVERTIGQDVSFVGDLDQDGFQDLLFAAPNYNVAIATGGSGDGLTGSGGAMVLYGPIDEAVRTESVQDCYSEDGHTCVEGASLIAASSIAVGYSVGAPGDISGDGVPDIVVSAIASDLLQGAVFIVSEPPYGAYDLETPGNSYLLSHSGNYDKYGFWGWKIDGMNDLDGDGVREMLVSAPGLGATLDEWTAGTVSTELLNESDCDSEVLGEICGGVDIVYGNTDFSMQEGGPSLQSNAEPMITLRGTIPYGATGFEAVVVGDVDGDGREDLVIGAPTATVGDADRVGVVYLVLNPLEGEMDLSDADAIIVGNEALDFLGYAAANLGDMDNDGLSDFAVGAPGIDLLRGIEQGHVPDSPGATYMFFQIPTDGDVIEVSDFALKGTSNPGMTGAALSAGDLDADGNQDLVVGEREHSTQGLLSGAAYVYYGPITRELIPEGDGAFILGSGTGTYAGHSVLTGGDLNNDGFHDLLIGASGVEDLVDGATGSISIFHGGSY